jgi:hypothetical protein
VQISAAKRMRDRAERDARADATNRVSARRLGALFGRSRTGAPA